MSVVYLAVSIPDFSLPTCFASECILLPSRVCCMCLPFRRRYIRIRTDASITKTNTTPPVTPPAIAAPGSLAWDSVDVSRNTDMKCDSFVLLEHLAMLLTSTLTLNC